ncbi:MAG: M23 family metallopeptidase [Clostridia bacterium]|nr:M23 family metallopeptidase [Clostridia bacterium]
MSKKERVITFLKKNGFYMGLAVAVLAITIIGAVALTSRNSNSVTPTFKPNSVSNSSTSSGSISSGSNSSSGSLPTVLTFIMPVENGEVTKEYTQDTVVFNQTLGVYSAHLAVDISGVEGAKVFCAYDGVIESIETSYLLGTVITIDHGNNLKTKYSSLDVSEDISVGQTVNKGEELGVISTANRQEYKDGAHLHFEVLKNNEKVNPMDYIMTEDNK